MFILVFIATILVLVLIHEWGHYYAAKRAGIKVLEFGFGLPPRLWGKKIGETIWSLNWLPFGGFVKLLGEDEDRIDSIKLYIHRLRKRKSAKTRLVTDMEMLDGQRIAFFSWQNIILA